TTDPASFAAVEREVHDQTRRQADLYVAGLLAQAGEQPEMAQHVAAVLAAAEVPLRAVARKNAPGWSALWAGWRSRSRRCGVRRQACGRRDRRRPGAGADRDQDG